MSGKILPLFLALLFLVLAPLAQACELSCLSNQAKNGLSAVHDCCNQADKKECISVFQQDVNNSPAYTVVASKFVKIQDSALVLFSSLDLKAKAERISFLPLPDAPPRFFPIYLQNQVLRL